MPLKIKNMKTLDFSCTSPSSTAICSSTNQHFMVKNTTKSSNNPLNTYLNHHYKTSSSPPRAPCINELPFTPRLLSSYREKTLKKPPFIVEHSDRTPRRKSSAEFSSSYYLLGESRYLDSLTETHHENDVTKNSKYEYDAWALVPSTTPKVVSTKEGYGKKSFGSFLDDEKEKKINEKEKKINKSLVVVNSSDERVIKSSSKHGNKQGYTITKYKSDLGYCKNDSIVSKKSTPSGIRSRDQVVVLRVSLHCRGCEGKLKKHLSKMEGVTSFSIDFETKKVTVIGNVTPLGVLTSISKVKYAQFWPSSSPSTSSTLEFN